MNPIALRESNLLQEIWENYMLCVNACNPEARHCETCSVQKRIDDACRDLDILQHSGMISGDPDSDKPNYAAASYDPLHIKEETMSELEKVQSADLNEPAEQPAELYSAEQQQPTTEQPAAQTQPTTYYDRFSGKEVDFTNISKNANRKLIFQSVLWFSIGISGLIWMIIGIIKLLA